MNTLVFGHKNPDTDSVCSSIAYAHYKDKIGEKVEPRVLGDLRREALFVLDYFDVPIPKLLNDVKVQARDLYYDKIVPLTTNTSVFEAYTTMEKEKLHSLPIVDESYRLIGMISIRDITRALINVNNNDVDTTLKSFISVFSMHKPKIIHSVSYNMKIQGNLKVFNPNIPQDSVFDEDDVIILKQYHKKEFFSKLKSHINFLILPQYDGLSDIEMEKIKKYDIPVISIDLNAPMIIKKVQQTDSISSIMKKEKIKYFQLKDYLNDIKDAMLKTNYRNYPIIDENGKYVGIIARKHLLKVGRKKVILVDHNEFAQSATGIEEANILEIVDHHKIGGINTSEPIQFLNMPVGSTCTIVYELFKNSRIDIPKKIAGCMISGILSDTLYFKSPTCTKKDIEAVESLNRILQLDLDDYTNKLFKAGSSIEGMSLKEILYNDFKEFNIRSRKIAISQLFTMDIDDLENKKKELLSYMQELSDKNAYNTLIFAVTDILKEGSYFYYISDEANILKQAFDIDKPGNFAPFIVSRKKQILPMLTNVLD